MAILGDHTRQEPGRLLDRMRTKKGPPAYRLFPAEKGQQDDMKEPACQLRGLFDEFSCYRYLYFLRNFLMHDLGDGNIVVLQRH